MTHQTFPKPAPKAKKRRRALPPRSEKGSAYQDAYDEITPLILARAHRLCEARLDCCTVEATNKPHHRKRRTQGGPNSMANLIAVCQPCHTWIHGHTGKSYDLGLLIRHRDPILTYVGVNA